MIEVDVEVEDAAWTAALPETVEVVIRAGRLALSPLHESGGARSVGAIAIVLADDDAVRDLNARFRGKDAATNVLSFPAAPNPEDHLGDIALAYGICAREALEQGKPLADHLAHLVIHGVLHLLGYDHQDEAEAERMESIERDLLAGLDIPDPYAQPGDRGGHVQSGG